MKILTPLHSIEDIEPLANAGAEEFYIGFSDPAWREQFGKFSDLNRCSVYEEANRTDYKDIRNFVAKAHSRGATLYAVLNAPFYGDNELERLRVYLEEFKDGGVDGVIVSTPEMIRLVREYDLKAVASVMTAVYNSDIAAYYRDLGANRIILPRELSTDDIAEIVSAVPEVEYEVFLMRNGCKHSDCYCLGMHGGEYGGLCYDQSMQRSALYMPEDTDANAFAVRDYNNYLYEMQFRNNACGQCAIYRFNNLGIAAGKIVGRMEDTSDIQQTVSVTAYNIKAANSAGSEEEYLQQVMLPGGDHEYCADGMSCYYPEVVFK